MKSSNPKFILRNYLLFQSIEELNEGKSDLFNELWDALQNPYEEKYPKFSAKRPSKFDDVAGCSMLSCSSWFELHFERRDAKFFLLLNCTIFSQIEDSPIPLKKKILIGKAFSLSKVLRKLIEIS